MPFRSGTVSYARFAVVGDAPTAPDEALISSMESCVVQPPSVGAPPETQAGFCAGRHVFDHQFDAETMSFGSSLVMGMRLDTNRVPAELKKAYRAMAEQAAAAESPTGFLNRAEKRIAREEAEDKCRRELTDGRHRSSRMMPVLWDLGRRLVLAPAYSDAKVSALSDLFHTGFDCSLRPLSAGAIAMETMSQRGLTRHYEDAAPTPFTAPPANAEREDGRSLKNPIVPWAFGGPEPSDFLGNEFLIWLWYLAAEHHGDIPGAAGETREAPSSVAILLDRSLDMECAWDATGKQSLRADGPTRLPEAIKALQGGKWPRKAGIMLASEGQQWSFVFQADRFLVTGLKITLPEDESPASAREEVEMRLTSLDSFDRALMSTYGAFLRIRFGDQWPTTRDRIKDWIHRSGKKSSPELPTVTTISRSEPVEISAS